MAFAKGSTPKNTDYAKGGGVLGRSTDFLKTANRFTGGKLPTPEPTEDDFEKGSSKANPKAADKSLKPVKPK
jgi:hypothetical protein